MNSGVLLTIAGFVLAFFMWLVKPSKQWQVDLRYLAGGVAVLAAAVGLGLLVRDRLSDEPDVVAPPALLRLAQPELRPTCEGTEDEFEGATRIGMECSPGSGADRVFYVPASSRAELDDIFRRRAQDRGLAADTCENNSNSRQTYEMSIPRTSGQLMCYVTGGRAHVEWTDRARRVYATASRDDVEDSELYKWWERSGYLSPGADTAAALLAGVPRGFRDDCIPEVHGVLKRSPATVLAGWECTTDEGYELNYYAFDSVSSLNSYFDAFRGTLSLDHVRGRSQDLCGEDERSVTGTYIDERTSRAGKLICYMAENDQRYIVWTEPSFLTYAYVTQEGGSAESVIRAWNYAGPE